MNYTDFLKSKVKKHTSSGFDITEQYITENCPLQLDVIERIVELYSNPGDTVFTPFMGIGSEVYQAVKMGRKGVGIELKPEYFEIAVENCKEATDDSQTTLFDEGE